MRRPLLHLSLLAALFAPLLACGGDATVAADAADTAGPADDTVAPADTAADASEDTRGDTAPTVAAIASQTFGPPEAWATPIADFLAAGEAEVKSLAFLRGIHDLVAYEGRLYLGFGDANLNLGRVFPIDFRAFTDPADATAHGELVSDEEQLERYRVVGADLLMAGVDATEDAWLGNVYRRTPEAGWVKHRTVQNGVHVHDVAGFQGAVYAVGSGATPEQWGAGDIYGHLWRSTDGLASWDIVAQVHNEGTGDSRLTRLLPFDDELWAFGYRTNAEGLIDLLPHGAWDGAAFTLLPADHALASVYVIETDGVGPSRGLVRGRDFGVSPSVQRAWWFAPNATATVIAAFDGLTVVDVDVVEATGELLALTVDGADWRPEAPGEKRVRAWVSAADGDTWSEVFDLRTYIPPKSIAWWRGAIYLGTDTGEVWRAAPE